MIKSRGVFISGVTLTTFFIYVYYMKNMSDQNLTLKFSETEITKNAIKYFAEKESIPLQPQVRFHWTKNRKNVSVVIGIPSVRRNGTSYLLDTMRNLLSNMNEIEKNQTLIVISIGETDFNYVNSVSEEIRRNFTGDFSSGLIEMIAPDPSYYHPKLDNLKRNLDDTLERVKWRSKENLDTIFLMKYAKDKGKYFLMIEDDVISKPEFITLTQEFIELSDKETAGNPWFIIKLCELGTVSTLFRSSDVANVAEYLNIFFDSKPIDWLFEEFLDTKYCSRKLNHEQCLQEKEKISRFINPSLIQHVGTFSSLSGKTQELIDDTFK